MFDALLLASFLTGPAFRAMTNGLPSSAAAGAGSTFFGVTFGFKASEKVDFAAGRAEAAAAIAGGSAILFADESAAGMTEVKGVTEAMLEAALAVAVSVEESGLSLISCRENEKESGSIEIHAHLQKFVCFRNGSRSCGCSCGRCPFFERICGNIQIIILSGSSMQVALAVDIIIHSCRRVHVPCAVGIFDKAGGYAQGGGNSVTFGI